MKRLFVLTIIFCLFLSKTNAQSKQPFFECCCGKRINIKSNFYHFEEETSNRRNIYIATTKLENIVPQGEFFYRIDGRLFQKGETCNRTMKEKMFCQRACAMNYYNTYYKEDYKLVDDPTGKFDDFLKTLSFVFDALKEDKPTKQASSEKNPNSNSKKKESNLVPVVKDNRGFPDCVDNYSGRIYNSNGEAIIDVQGETWILTKDGKYINRNGGKGTWKCDGYSVSGAPQINFQSESSNNPGFPDCVDNYSGRVYNASGEAIIKIEGDTWVLNKDGHYINTKGRGTWACDGYTEDKRPLIKFEVENSADNKISGNVSAINQFPPCVTGLKKYQDPTLGDYYYGSATDDSGNNFTTLYFATKKTSSDGTTGNTVFVKAPSNEKPWSGVYWCSGDDIVINSWDGNIKLKAQIRVSDEYTQADKTSIENYNTGGLELFIGDGNTLNRRDVSSAVNTLVQYISQYTRSNYYGWFLEMLGSIKSFLQSQNLPREVEYINNEIMKFKSAIDAVKTNDVANKQGLNWDVLSDPLPQEQKTVYSPTQNLKEIFPFTNAKEPLFLYKLKSQKSSRVQREQADAMLTDFMAGKALDETYCECELKLLIQYANQPGLIKGMAQKVSDTYFDPEQIKPMKQVIKLCSRANLLNSKKYGKALNWLQGAEDKYKVDFGAKCSEEQPPNPIKCE